MIIRAFTSEDYASFARIQNIAYSDFAETEVDLRLRDDRTPDYCHWSRWIAECDGQVVGFADYSQNMYGYDPRKYSLRLGVDPAYLGQRIGASLYESVLNTLQRLGPLSLDASARADMSCRISFLERRGFARNSELFVSTVDLTMFDPSHWTEASRRLAEQGLRVTTLEQLGAADEDVVRQLYDMWQDIRRDMPIPPGEERAAVSFEQWWEQMNVPSLNPSLFFIALDGDRFVGTSQLFFSPEPEELRTGLTGVVRSHRRRGIALGLKVHALSAAREHGFKRVITENAGDNVGMLAINAQLGFMRNPAWIRYVKSFEPAAPA